MGKNLVPMVLHGDTYSRQRFTFAFIGVHWRIILIDLVGSDPNPCADRFSV